MAPTDIEKQTRVQYEIAMSIGNSTDLKSSLKESMTTILRKLDGIGIGIIDKNNIDLPISHIPRRSYDDTYAHLARQAFDHKANGDVSDKHLLLFKQTKEESCYFFNLNKTGLLLFRKRQPLDDVSIKILHPLCHKLDNSIQACFATKQLRKKEQELEKSLHELKHAQNAKDRFLATLAHEIRTPLNGVIGFIEQLTETKLTKTQQYYIEVINQSSDTLMGTINDTLDFSKIESGLLELDFQPINLKTALEPAIELFKCKASEKNILLMVEIDELLDQGVMADSLRLRQVISNLVSNAIKFTEKGYVSVSIKAVEEDGECLTVLFFVEDSGIGIDQKNLSDIFNPFLQADKSMARRYGGTGLGLAISYQLVQKMKGNLTVDSQKDKGSVFAFQLTFSKTQLLKHTPIRELTNHDYSQKRVLVVEDNKVNQLLISAILDSINIQFDITNNGEEAINAYKKSSYDLVLMDINMPVMDGLTALTHIRELEKNADQFPKVPIIALTANALLGDRENYIQRGMDDVLTKPLKKLDLHQVFDTFLLIK